MADPVEALGQASRSRITRFRAALVASAIGAVIILGSPVAAFGYWGGYGPNPGPPAGFPPGLYDVVTAQSVTSAGGTISGSEHGASVAVTIPAGSFPQGAEIVIYTTPTCSIHIGRGTGALVDFLVEAIDPATGAVLRGSFSPALSITVHSWSISRGDYVVQLGAPGQTRPIWGAWVGEGTASFTVRSLPSYFAVVTTNWWKMARCFSHWHR